MWEYSHEGKQLENKWVFRRLQKTGKVCADVMSGGRLFQSRLPATAKARYIINKKTVESTLPPNPLHQLNVKIPHGESKKYKFTLYSGQNWSCWNGCVSIILRSLHILPGVCLLATSHKNYWSHLHENFTRDVSLNKKSRLKFPSHPDLDNRD